MKAEIINLILRVPLFNLLIRRMADKFKEGSIVRIKSGIAKGMLWKRYHRYVNGYWVGIYELPIQKRIKFELKYGDVFFDIGANAGFLSLVGAKAVGYSGRVIAFEPLPMNAYVIEEQFELNNLKQCQCIRCAIGERIGKSEIFLLKNTKGEPSPSRAYLLSRTSDINEGHVMKRFNVDVITLDHFCQKHNLIPDLIKIDVEGAEADVLRGAKGLLHSDRAPRIIMETHGITVANDVNNQLKEAEYNFFTISGEPLRDGLIERHYLAYPAFINKKPSMF